MIKPQNFLFTLLHETGQYFAELPINEENGVYRIDAEATEPLIRRYVNSTDPVLNAASVSAHTDLRLIHDATQESAGRWTKTYYPARGELAIEELQIEQTRLVVNKDNIMLRNQWADTSVDTIIYLRPQETNMQHTYQKAQMSTRVLERTNGI